MKLRRTPIVFAFVAGALGMMTACSDEADQAADTPAEQVTPAPTTPDSSVPPSSTPPMDSSPSTTTPAN